MIGNTRIVVCLVLAMATVARAQQIIRVDAASGCTTGGTCSGCGGTWAAAYHDLKEAVDCAQPPTEVWVAAGTYALTATISLRADVKVIGGFDKAETSASQSDPGANVTVVDGGGAVSCFAANGAAGSGILRGLSVARGLGAYPAAGGLTITDSSPLVVNCAFEENFTNLFGGAVILWTGSPRFVNCIFRANTHIYDEDEEILGELLVGGAAYLHRGSPTFTNCLFHGNHAGEGGAIATFRAPAVFFNCTFVGNKATRYGGGAISSGASLEMRNSIVWSNTAEDPDVPIQMEPGSVLAATHSDIQGGWTGQGNINADPLFTNPGSGDYTLLVGSPCRNTGSNGLVPSDIADLDWDDNKTETTSYDLKRCYRFKATVEIGAYEFSSFCPGSQQ